MAVRRASFPRFFTVTRSGPTWKPSAPALWQTMQRDWKRVLPFPASPFSEADAAKVLSTSSREGGSTSAIAERAAFARVGFLDPMRLWIWEAESSAGRIAFLVRALRRLGQRSSRAMSASMVRVRVEVGSWDQTGRMSASGSPRSACSKASIAAAWMSGAVLSRMQALIDSSACGLLERARRRRALVRSFAVGVFAVWTAFSKTADALPSESTSAMETPALRNACASSMKRASSTVGLVTAWMRARRVAGRVSDFTTAVSKEDAIDFGRERRVGAISAKSSVSADWSSAEVVQGDGGADLRRLATMGAR